MKQTLDDITEENAKFIEQLLRSAKKKFDRQERVKKIALIGSTICAALGVVLGLGYMVFLLVCLL